MKPPKPPKPTVHKPAKPKKPAAPKPYNPLTSTLPSLAQLQKDAQAHAQKDVNAQLGALPSANYYQGLGAALQRQQQGVVDNQASLARSAGDLFSQGFASANQGARSAAIAAGGHPTDNTGAVSNLLGALGASTASGLAGAPLASGRQTQMDLQSLANRRAAVRMGMPALAEKYLADSKDEAFRIASTQLNAQMAASQAAALGDQKTAQLLMQKYGIDSTNARATQAEAGRNARTAAQINAANQRAANALNARLTKDSKTGSGGASKTRQQAYNSALKQYNTMLKASIQTGTDANGYPVLKPKYSQIQMWQALVSLFRNGYGFTGGNARNVARAIVGMAAPAGKKPNNGQQRSNGRGD